MERLIRNIVKRRGHKDHFPEYPGSRNPAQKRIRMEDVLFLNFFWYKGHKTASAPCLTETFGGTCTSAAIRQTASPRGILHLIIFGAHTFLHKTNFVVRLSQHKTNSWHESAREFLCRRETKAEKRPQQTTIEVRLPEELATKGT
jgi:hypothetical protein